MDASCVPHCADSRMVEDWSSTSSLASSCTRRRPDDVAPSMFAVVYAAASITWPTSSSTSSASPYCASAPCAYNMVRHRCAALSAPQLRKALKNMTDCPPIFDNVFCVSLNCFGPLRLLWVPLWGHFRHILIPLGDLWGHFGHHLAPPGHPCRHMG